ncbi:carbonic anhydrase 4b [Hypomesus transpacificus]|uniref:carbonic anhydrase 4b n=1 Tax=Hypomesus transpacificus TaxID=137520 RepID=UPI001F078863|nr:carbonic anhydrase 4b [Hypomesus transpacificus]
MDTFRPHLPGSCVHIILMSTVVGVISGADWCYYSQVSCDNNCTGPNGWVKVAEMCGSRFQSPINIVTKKVEVVQQRTGFKFTGYQDSFNSLITNNGHTVQVDLTTTATVLGAHLPAAYKAVQLHLHWGEDGGPGSEHTIDGERYPMELHIVHIKETHNSLAEALKDPTGVAVLGFFYEESTVSNRKYDSIINALNSIKQPNTNTSLNGIALDMLIPSRSNMTSYYYYNGSLTTPNCAESVVWTVFENTIPLSKQQLAAFSKLWFADALPMVGTYRPVKPLNGRRVYYSGGHVVLLSTLLLVCSLLSAIEVSLPDF